MKFVKISYPKSLRGIKLEDFERQLNEVLDKYGFTGKRRHAILEKCLADFKTLKEGACVNSSFTNIIKKQEQ
jgi:hypothetical protein